MPIDLGALGDDLVAEHADLDRILVGLDDAAWDAPTPAEGWLVRDQVSHIAFGDDRARFAASDRPGFEAYREASIRQPGARQAEALRFGREAAPATLLDYWRDQRARMLEVFRGLDPATRIPWFGPDMSAASFITARLMETWAHGQDIIDTIGIQRRPTDRLRHVAHIGIQARPFSYTIHGRETPTDSIAVELVAPDGETWRWGDPAAPDRVRGSALDFCLVVTQRRHPADTGLVVEGPVAREWIGIAQAFAGPPGAGRRPGQFVR